ncbi:hypothetical protein MKW92_047507, partial [Papaver armeniacum]
SIPVAPPIKQRTRASSQSSSSSSARLSNTAYEEPIQVDSSTSSSAEDDTFLASQDEHFYGQINLQLMMTLHAIARIKISIIVMMVYVMVGMLKVRSSNTSRICIFMALQI